jgi:WD40 repeat protein
MNRHRGLWAGIFVLLILAGCSKDKKLNVEGAFSPVIVNLSSDHTPTVRGIVNALTAVVSNPRGYTLVYHWSAGAGQMSDTTAQTAHWTPPDSIGVYPVTVAVQAHDDLNNVDFYKTRTFQVYVDNDFQRWTHTIAVQFDVAAPVAGKIYYSEIRNSATGESDIWALATPLGAPEQITHDFLEATGPSVQSDGSRVAFLGRRNIGEGGASLYQVPSTGGDTTSAGLMLRWAPSGTINFISAPRFAPTGSMVAYATDTIGVNAFQPKPWMRDAANPNTQPIPILPTTTAGLGSVETNNSYWSPAWSGDSVVTESFVTFATSPRVSRGFFKFSALGSPPTNPEPFSPWIVVPDATEPDWSPDGQHVVFVRRAVGRTDRDLWIINAHSSDPATAKRVTSGIADEFHPRFSTDGTKIFFMSNRVDGYGANGFYDTERRGVNIWSVGRFDLP